MLEGVIIELANLLRGQGGTNQLPLASREMVDKFNRLQKGRSPVHTGASAKEKQDAATAIQNRLLVAPQGITLVNDLVTLQQGRNGVERFHIKFHFGSMPINEDTGEPRQALGFTEIDDPEREDGIRTDIPLYFRYERDGDAYETSYPAEDGVNLAGKIMMASSRLSLTIFHELMHVWYFRNYLDRERSGHTSDGDGDIVFEDGFIKPIKRFRNEIFKIESALRTR